MAVIRLHEFGAQTERSGLRGFPCTLCGRFVVGDRVSRQGCTSPRAEQMEAVPLALAPVVAPSLELPCRFRLGGLCQVGCCGGPITIVYECEKLGPCVLAKADAELIEYQGKPVTPCEGCTTRAIPHPALTD